MRVYLYNELVLVFLLGQIHVERSFQEPAPGADPYHGSGDVSQVGVGNHPDFSPIQSYRGPRGLEGYQSGENANQVRVE